MYKSLSLVLLDLKSLDMKGIKHSWILYFEKKEMALLMASFYL